MSDIFFPYDEDQIRYDTELERVLKQYDDAVREEKHLLIRKIYEFEHSNFIYIDCGLSAARDFTPAIRIKHKYDDDNRISFNPTQWLFFIKKLKLIVNSNYSQNEEQCLDSVEVSIVDIIKKVVKVNQNSKIFYLMEYDVLEIIKMEKVLLKIVDTLYQLDFNNYYFKVLESIEEILNKNNFNVPFIEVVEAFCNINNSIQSYCLFECLLYLKEKVLNDIHNLGY